MQSDNPTAAILLIGDELLSGRTRDSNAHHLAGVLNGIGIDLREIRVVADDHAAIVSALRALDRALGGAWDMVFTSGGIGPTHDDITADAVAERGMRVLTGPRWRLGGRDISALWRRAVDLDGADRTTHDSTTEQIVALAAPDAEFAKALALFEYAPAAG